MAVDVRVELVAGARRERALPLGGRCTNRDVQAVGVGDLAVRLLALMQHSADSGVHAESVAGEQRLRQALGGALKLDARSVARHPESAPSRRVLPVPSDPPYEP